MQPTEDFHINDLIACANRETGFRKSYYPKWAKVTRIEDLPAGKQREIDMMAAIPERLKVLNDSALALQAFKDFVHTTLDNAGVDKHEEQNATTGCRVGARLADLIKAAATPAPAAPLADAELAELAEWFDEVGREELAAAERFLEKHNEGPGAAAIQWLLADLPGLLARLQKAEAPKWVNVEERLPEDCQDYLVYVQPRHEVFACVKISSLNPAKTGFYVEYTEDGQAPLEDVTHWQPLPAAPTVKGGQST